VVKGPSSGGKSFVVETVLKAFPQSAYLDFTSMSEHALVYDERPIANRFIVLYEASGLGQDKQGEPSVLAYCVRSLLSEGRISYTTVDKTDEGMQARVIEREGPTGLITTTTWATLHPENETRMLSVAISDTVAQTASVFGALANRCNGQQGDGPDLEPWLALQSWLELAGERRVTIPYAHELAKLASPRAVRLRRDFGKVLSLIQTHAILHQANRERDDQGRIVATLADYAAVHALVSDIINEGVQATVAPTVRETVEAVRQLREQALAQAGGDEAEAKPVRVGAVARALGLDSSAASRRIAAAQALGYVVNEETRYRQPAKLVLGEPLPGEEHVLPTPEELQKCVQAYPSDPRAHVHTLEDAQKCVQVYPSERRAHVHTLEDVRVRDGDRTSGSSGNQASFRWEPEHLSSSVITDSVQVHTLEEAPTERILQALRNAPHSAEYLAANLHMDRAIVDGTLDVLEDAGEIVRQGDKVEIYAEEEGQNGHHQRTDALRRRPGGPGSGPYCQAGGY